MNRNITNDRENIGNKKIATPYLYSAKIYPRKKGYSKTLSCVVFKIDTWLWQLNSTNMVHKNCNVHAILFCILLLWNIEPLSLLKLNFDLQNWTKWIVTFLYFRGNISGEKPYKKWDEYTRSTCTFSVKRKL